MDDNNQEHECAGCAELRAEMLSLELRLDKMWKRLSAMDEQADDYLKCSLQKQVNALATSRYGFGVGFDRGLGAQAQTATEASNKRQAQIMLTKKQLANMGSLEYQRIMASYTMVTHNLEKNVYIMAPKS